MYTRIIGLGAGVLAVLATLTPSAISQEPAPTTAEEQSDLARRHFRAVRERYASASWTRGPAREGLALAALKLEGWNGAELHSDAGYMTRAFTSTAPGAAEASFIVEARVSDDAQAAHETLVTWLAGVSSVQRMPALREWNLAFGDAGFVGPSGAGPRALSWIAFVRGNVAVRVLAVDPVREVETRSGLDIAGVAARIDAAILARKALEPDTTPARPVIARFKPSRTAVTAGENVGLDVLVDDPYGGAAHLEWIVGGPGQGYVEAGPDGKPKLHTTGPGKITLTLQATGSTGTFAQSSIEIAVADD